MKEFFAQVRADEEAAGYTWCEYGVMIVAGSPDDPQDYYNWDYAGYGNAWSTGPGFLGCVYMFNPPKGRALLLRSIGEISAAMDNRPERAYLAGIAAETADLADARAWCDAQPSDGSAVRDLLESVLTHFETDSMHYAWDCFFVLCTAYAEVNGVTHKEASPALQSIWQSRCTLAEWAPVGTITYPG